MALRTIQLPQDDPHVLAFLAGSEDRVTLLSKRLLESFAFSAAKIAHQVYDELEQLAEEYGVDVRRLMWAFAHPSWDFLSIQEQYRISAAGAFALFRLARVIAPGLVQEGMTEAYNEVMRTPVLDRNNPPFAGDRKMVREAMAAFARWAHTTLKFQLQLLWRMKLRQASGMARTALAVLYGISVGQARVEQYLLWDVQEGLARPKSYLSFSDKARLYLGEVLRWLIDLQGPGRTRATQ